MHDVTIQIQGGIDFLDLFLIWLQSDLGLGEKLLWSP